MVFMIQPSFSMEPQPSLLIHPFPTKNRGSCLMCERSICYSVWSIINRGFCPLVPEIMKLIRWGYYVNSDGWDPLNVYGQSMVNGNSTKNMLAIKNIAPMTRAIIITRSRTPNTNPIVLYIYHKYDGIDGGIDVGIDMGAPTVAF